MKKFFINNFSLQDFNAQLNSKAHSPYLFEIINETYIDIKFDRNVPDDQQICGLIKLLYVKLPILLDRQSRDQVKGCAAFQLKFDIDAVTKEKKMEFPILVIEYDKLIFDPMICDQKTYFQNLEQKIITEQQVEMQVDIEQFGIILILFKLRNLLNKKFQDSNAVFDIMIYPSVLNFAIIKKYGNNEFLYFHDENHKELFFKQNSKYHPIDLANSVEKITLHSRQIVNMERNAKTQNDEQNTKAQENGIFFYHQNREQIEYYILSVYNKADIIEKGILIANRNDNKFREKIKYTSNTTSSNDEEIFYAVKNDCCLFFSKSCKTDKILHHQVRMKDNQALKCSCGNEITKENFDKLVMDFQFQRLINLIQWKLLYDKNLDSCIFKISLNVHLKSDQYQNQFAVVSINDQILFEIPYNLRVNHTQFSNESEQKKHNLFEKNDYNTEEDWTDELEQNEQRNDANKTQEVQITNVYSS